MIVFVRVGVAIVVQVCVAVGEGLWLADGVGETVSVGEEFDVELGLEVGVNVEVHDEEGVSVGVKVWDELGVTVIELVSVALADMLGL